ncbi:MAG TPA: SGNH/GDSL hydrolase family protein [Azospirillaceae bacterium]|nr:SGNH/GDSL hydrolase family protein [Azospirillaceae bacterium]
MDFSTKLLMAAVLGVVVSAGAQAAPAFDRLVVFGDSLSDNGNAGRFSNGPVWVEHLAQHLSLTLRPARDGGGNFAVGGARLDPLSGPFSLRAQADLFLRLPPLRGRTLYVVYGGGNDLLAAVGALRAAAAVDAAVVSARGIVGDLVARGAADILVPNLPDVGMTPEMRSRGKRAMEEARRLSERFNDGLERVLADVVARPGIRLYRLDVWGMAERVRADPAVAGFTDVTTPCNGSGRCEGMVFWDYVHPTTAAHARLGEAALRVLRGEAPYP